MTQAMNLPAIKEETVDLILRKVQTYQNKNEIDLPRDYSVSNALKSAWLILQETVDKDKRPALQVCTRESITNSLLDMVVQGLNPAKKQGYFIVYGSNLLFQRSYFGTIAVTKRVADAEDIYCNIVYQGDIFEYEINRGRVVVTKHSQKLENIRPNGIVAAYCQIVFKDGREYTGIMTWEQIQKAWTKSRMNPNNDGSTHKMFPEEMARKTVINRTCKVYINSSSDKNLLHDAFNRADEELDEAVVDHEIEEKANKGEVIDIVPATMGLPEPPPPPEGPEAHPDVPLQPPAPPQPQPVMVAPDF